MEYSTPITIAAVAIISLVFYLKVIKPKGKTECQKSLDEARNTMLEDEISLENYENRELTLSEIGTLYERYIGHLYEKDGCDVEYHGAINGVKDLGRDLIVQKGKDTLVIQTKCWGKDKLIHAKDIFQLYGSMEHLRATTKSNGQNLKAVFYTSSASYTGPAIEVAQDLGVDLKTKKLNSSYPVVKCKVSAKGEKTYHLPFDLDYDHLKVDPEKGEFFAGSIVDAFEKGHRRSQDRANAA